jgi:hypothetical protein
MIKQKLDHYEVMGVEVGYYWLGRATRIEVEAYVFHLGPM